MTGTRFGRLIVLGDGRVSRTGFITYRCRCDCGESSDVYPHNLKSGRTRPCGCLRAERMRANRSGGSEGGRKHAANVAAQYAMIPRVDVLGSCRSRVLSIVAGGEWYTPMEIAGRLGLELGKFRGLYQTLSRLVKAGALRREAGRYGRAA